MRARKRLASLVFAVVVLIGPGLQTPPVQAQADCSFGPTFQALRDLIPEIVGDCLANEAPNPETGLVEQPTTGGTLLWRPSDSLAGFRNAETLWLAGPDGVVSRSLQEPPFAWEGEALAVAPVAPVEQPAAPAEQPAPPQDQPAAAAVPPCAPMEVFRPGPIQPPSGLDARIAALSGIWQGDWEPRGQFFALPSRLAVRQLQPSQAAVTYAWQGAGAFRGSVNLNAAVLPHGAVTWGTGTFQNPRFIFTISDDLQTLNGTREAGGATDRIGMTRCSG